LPGARFGQQAGIEADFGDVGEAARAGGQAAILVDRGVDRRKAEKAVEDLIEYCKQRRKSPSDMTLNEWT